MDQVVVINNSENPRAQILNLFKNNRSLTLKEIKNTIPLPPSIIISILEEFVKSNKLEKKVIIGKQLVIRYYWCENYEDDSLDNSTSVCKSKFNKSYKLFK